MKALTTLTRLLTAKRRAAHHHAEFIRLIRQAAALLAAGRPLTLLWEEVARAHPACQTAPPPQERNPRCCLHHVVVAQRSASLLGQPVFATVTAPGPAEHWQQLSATLTLAQHTGLSIADVLGRLADALEAGEDARQARDTASAGPRATARLLAWLPLVGLGLAQMMGASIIDFATTWFGISVVVSGVAFAVAGRIWSQRMITTASTP